MVTLICVSQLNRDALINQALDQFAVGFVGGGVDDDDAGGRNIRSCSSCCAASCELLVLFR